jgi:hypothetical protein
MKSLKHLAVAGFAAAALGQSAFAVDHVYITGSTAFRTAAINAITAAVGLTGSGTLASGGGTGNDTNIAGTGKTSFIWEGGHDPVTGNPVTVVATFTGSASGVGIVATATAIPFLPDGATGINNPSAYDDSQGTTPHAGYAKFVPDFTFSDVYQSTTPFNTTAGYLDMSGNDQIVAICTFKWMASKNFPLGTTGGSTASTLFSSYNVTPSFIKQLYQSGAAPLAFLSGNTADQHKEIFATGRNPDSGTRLTTFADGLYGVTNNVKQYHPTISSGAVTAQSLYPIETIFGLISTGSTGNSGEATGGNLRTFLQATLPTSGLTGQNAGCTGAYYMTYLGISDASAVEGNSGNLTGAVELTYGGVLYSTAAIQQGQYSFWSYEHVLDRGDLAPTGGAANTAAATDIETTVISTIQGWDSNNTNINGSGLQDDTNMKVKRSGDGLFIKPKYVF